MKKKSIRKEIIGRNFNGVEVLSCEGKKNNGNKNYYKVKCHCGRIFITRSDNLKVLKSCGCLGGKNNIDYKKAQEIRKLWISNLGLSVEVIAKKYNTSMRTIYDILKNKIYTKPHEKN